MPFLTPLYKKNFSVQFWADLKRGLNLRGVPDPPIPSCGDATGLLDFQDNDSDTRMHR